MKKLNPVLLPRPQGINNIGNTCYLNTAIQLLTTSTSLVDDIRSQGARLTKELKDTNYQWKPNQKHIYAVRIKLIELIITPQSHMGGIVIQILDNYCKFNPETSFLRDRIAHAHQQQDSHEMYMMILDCIYDGKPVRPLYIRTRVSISCPCGYHHHPDNQNEDNLYNSLIPIKNDQIKEFIRLAKNGNKPEFFNFYFNMREPIEDYKCDNCNKTTTISKISKITLVQSVITILLPFHKVVDGAVIGLDPIIKVQSKDTTLNYKRIACGQKSGGIGGGHWQSRVLRNDGVYEISDSHGHKIEGETPKIDINTVYCIYHLI